MKQEQTYHIDVTEEEALLFTDLPKPDTKAKNIKPRAVSFSKVFGLVLGIHVAAAAALFGVSLKPLKTDDKPAEKPKESVYTTEQQSAALQSKNTKLTPAPTPTPAKVPKPAVKTNDFTKEYVVKQGDTIFSIANKYKLNVDRLIKINDIKDVNKIQIGQTLKFM